MQILAGVLRIGKVDVRDDVHDAAVRLLRKALILAAVARLHMENRDVQTLRRDRRKTGIGISENKECIGLNGRHQLIGTVDDIADGGAEVVPHGVHVDIWLLQLEVAEEDAVEVIVVVLPRVREDGIEILAALADDGGEADDLRPRAHDDEQLQPAVVLKVDIGVIKFHGVHANQIPSIYHRFGRQSRMRQGACVSDTWSLLCRKRPRSAQRRQSFQPMNVFQTPTFSP